jgi:hypothetical protein
MSHYRSLPAKPRKGQQSPSYPKLLGLGMVVAAAACGGTAVQGGEGGTGGTASPDGDVAPAYDAGTAGAAGSGSAGMAGWGTGGGGAPYPYDSGVAGEAGSGGTGVAGSGGGGAPIPYDAGDAQDEQPPLQGEAPDPFDGGMDAWPDVIDGAIPDGASAGYAPGPYDAACETSVPVDDSGA